MNLWTVIRQSKSIPRLLQTSCKCKWETGKLKYSKMSNEIVIEINQGKLKGLIKTDYKNGKYFSFQGVPYAEPPIGELRFKNPLPPKKWSNIFDATKERSESLSRHSLFREKIIGSEDCLYLNIYTPQLPKNDTFKPRPVMFWIHGGGLLYGSGNTDVCGPDYLITEDVVLVTINYRLGILGFLSLEDPSLNVSGNAGFKDMVQALKWVKENINNFGGDPNNVTIFGESAGGAACHLLILSPMAKGLFHKAILQSGCALNPWLYGKKVPQKIAEVLGFKSNNEKHILTYLQTIPEGKFMEAQDILQDSLGGDAIRTTGFVIENPSTTEENFITQHPMEIMASGNFNKVPMIIGYLDREGLITELAGPVKIDQIQNINSQIPWYYNIEKNSETHNKIADKIKNFYFKNGNVTSENIDQYFQLVTDTLFWRGIYVSTRELQKHLNEIYLYRFMLDSNVNFFKKIKKIHRNGACHCDDLGYIFKIEYLPEIEQDSKEVQLIETVVKLWTNFAKTSKPISSDCKIKWIPVQKDKFNCLDIADNFPLHTNPDLERMKFWDEISASLNSKF